MRELNKFINKLEDVMEIMEEKIENAVKKAEKYAREGNKQISERWCRATLQWHYFLMRINENLISVQTFQSELELASATATIQTIRFE